MFTGLRSHLMLSFSLLLLVCLGILTLTFILLFPDRIKEILLSSEALVDASAGHAGVLAPSFSFSASKKRLRENSRGPETRTAWLSLITSREWEKILAVWGRLPFD